MDQGPPGLVLSRRKTRSLRRGPRAGKAYESAGEHVVQMVADGRRHQHVSAVALGAFGAHALKARLTPEMMAVYQPATSITFIMPWAYWAWRLRPACEAVTPDPLERRVPAGRARAVLGQSLCAEPHRAALDRGDHALRRDGVPGGLAAVCRRRVERAAVLI